MNQTSDTETLDVLKEIRDGQRELIALLQSQRVLAEDQLRQSQQRVDESIGLQKLALRRARITTAIALPGILACIAAIAWLLLRYF